MSKDTKIISVQLTQPLADALHVAAQAAPYNGNKSQLLRDIIEESEMTPNSIRLLALEQQRQVAGEQAQEQLDELQADIDDQLAQIDALDRQIDRLETQNEHLRANIDSLDKVVEQTQEQLAADLEESTALLIKHEQLKIKYDYMLDELDRSHQQVSSLQAQNQQLTARVAELQQEPAAQQRASGWFDTLGQGVNTILNLSPGLKQNFEQGGLNGVLHGVPKPSIDQALAVDFPNEALPDVKEALLYFRDQPTELTRLLASEAFRAYLANHRPSSAGSSRPTTNQGPQPTAKAHSSH